MAVSLCYESVYPYLEAAFSINGEYGLGIRLVGTRPATPLEADELTPRSPGVHINERRLDLRQ
jgi:hypothetical protein